MKFAAFIMTYERPAVVINTIRKIFEQTLPPQKVLVVDNSETSQTSAALKAMADPRIEYLRVGYNAGPAGAAKRGLRKLKEEGFEWIHWADDDDPPAFNDAFEVLLDNVDGSVGVIGAVGSKFDWRTGLKKRYPDDQLTGILSADSIGGGYCMIVNAKAVTAETLPDENLFFGMEEFDFCQRVKRTGFSVVVSGELMYRYRKLNNKLGVDKRPSLLPRRSIAQIRREYYSYRNAIYLMIRTYKKPLLVLRYLLRIGGKVPMGFTKGFSYGMKNFWVLSLAVVHAFAGRMGKQL